MSRGKARRGSLTNKKNSGSMIDGKDRSKEQKRIVGRVDAGGFGVRQEAHGWRQRRNQRPRRTKLSCGVGCQFFDSAPTPRLSSVGDIFGATSTVRTTLDWLRYVSSLEGRIVASL